MSPATISCVLCSNPDHIGSNCPEKVCILCFSPDHVYTECENISENIKTEPDEDDDVNIRESKCDDSTLDVKTELPELKEEQTENEDYLNSVVKIKCIKEKEIVCDNAKISPKDSINVRSVKEEDSNSVSRSGYACLSESEFQEDIIHLFDGKAPREVIETFKKSHCGMCQESFSSEKYAWKHYFSQDHKKLLKSLPCKIKSKTPTIEKEFTYPPFWKIILFALEENESLGKSRNDIFCFIIERFQEIKANMSPEDIKEKIRTSLDYMCDFYQNAREKRGIYFMKQRGREELAKLKANREFEGEIDYSAKDGEMNKHKSIKDIDIYKAREKNGRKRHQEFQDLRYSEKRQRFDASDKHGYRRSQDYKRTRDSRDSSRYDLKRNYDSQHIDKRYKDSVKITRSRSQQSPVKITKRRSPKSPERRHSNSERRSNSRKSESLEKEPLLTPPPEVSQTNFGILPQNVHPSNAAPIIIMAPENLTSGMFNMLPAMNTIHSNYFNSLFPVQTLQPAVRRL